MNLKELSALLGLSQTTVSRALNGYPEVNEQTRERIRQAAEKHGYRPNARARSLATGQSRTIGHVIPVSEETELVNPIFMDFIAGANAVYSRHGYAMKLSLAPDGQEETIYRDLARSGHVDGVVVQVPHPDDPRIKLLTDLGMPFVVHGRTGLGEHPYSWVDVDNEKAIYQLTTHLIGLGHRRIALVNGKRGLQFAHSRAEGFRRALSDAGLTASDDLMIWDDMSEPAGCAATHRLLAVDPRPTAVLCSSMISALGARRAIAEAGLAFARDVSVAAFDDCLSYLGNGTAEAPVFTSVASSVQEAGRFCAQMLMGRINAPGADPTHKLLTAKLVEGSSTARLA